MSASCLSPPHSGGQCWKIATSSRPTWATKGDFVSRLEGNKDRDRQTWIQKGKKQAIKVPIAVVGSRGQLPGSPNQPMSWGLPWLARKQASIKAKARDTRSPCLRLYCACRCLSFCWWWCSFSPEPCVLFPLGSSSLNPFAALSTLSVLSLYYTNVHMQDSPEACHLRSLLQSLHCNLHLRGWESSWVSAQKGRKGMLSIKNMGGSRYRKDKHVYILTLLASPGSPTEQPVLTLNNYKSSPSCFSDCHGHTSLLS